MKQEEKIQLYTKVQTELKDSGIDISIEEIESVVTSQFKIMIYAFSKGISITMPYLGKFITVPYQKLQEGLINPNKKKQSELIKEGKIQEAKEAMVESIKKYDKIIRDIKNEKELDVDTVINLPHLENSEVFDLFKVIK